MQEALPQVPQGEQQNTTLEPKPREFSLTDVVNAQKYLQRLKASPVPEADFLPSENGLYDALTEDSYKPEAEPTADEHCFDKTLSTLLGAWAALKGSRETAPTTLKGIKELFALYPNLNDSSPIHFQGGDPHAAPARFIHVKTGRVIGKNREPATSRYYLNPASDKMGDVVESLTGAALQSNVPLYFKFVDIASGTPFRRVLERTDRIVIYASEAQTGFINSTLSNIVTEMPEAFTSRRVAGFGEVLADGIARADEVMSEQDEKYKGYGEGPSFNSLRSKLIFEATLAVTRDLIIQSETATINVDGITIRQKFASELSRAISVHREGTEIKEDDPMLLRALQLELSPEQLMQSGQFGDNAVRAIETAVAKTARDILPSIQPEGLLHGYQHHIKKNAPKYGIDPDNLARNIPIAA